MIEEKYIDLITGYLQDSLTPAEQQRLNDLVEEGKIDLFDIRQMKAIYEQIGSLELPEPKNSMRKRFYTLLEQEKIRQQNTPIKQITQWLQRLRGRFEIRRVAYPAVLFLIGLLVGDLYAPISNRDAQIDRLTAEVYRMREVMMISLLDDASPTERLKAVNIGNEIRKVDDRIITALLKTLNSDSNVNVRVAAVEALVSHASNSAVRTGLVNSIVNQESPIVQAALADAMLVLQERQAIEKFKKLLEQEELDSSVRSKLENTIAALS